MSSPVRGARPLNVELPADIVTTAQDFRVTLTDAAALERFLGAAVRSANLAEFQAAMTHEP